jgi:hypothetical protein
MGYVISHWSLNGEVSNQSTPRSATDGQLKMSNDKYQVIFIEI